MKTLGVPSKRFRMLKPLQGIRILHRAPPPSSVARRAAAHCSAVRVHYGTAHCSKAQRSTVQHGAPPSAENSALQRSAAQYIAVQRTQDDITHVPHIPACPPSMIFGQVQAVMAATNLRAFSDNDVARCCATCLSEQRFPKTRSPQRMPQRNGDIAFLDHSLRNWGIVL